MKSETYKVLRRLFFVIKDKRKVQIIFLIIISILSGISEMISIGSVVPFLVFLNDPNLLWQNKFVHVFANVLGIYSANNLLLPLTIVFCFAAIFAGAIKMFNLWLGGRVSALVGTDLAIDGYKGIIFQSYSKIIEKKKRLFYLQYYFKYGFHCLCNFSNHSFSKWNIYFYRHNIKSFNY